MTEGTCVRYLYGTGFVLFNDLADQLSDFGGKIKVKVVKENNQRGEKTLCYGLFYEDSKGRMYDVLQPSNFSLKVYNRSEPLLAIMKNKLGVEEIALPLLTEKNCIRKKEINF